VQGRWSACGLCCALLRCSASSSQCQRQLVAVPVQARRSLLVGVVSHVSRKGSLMTPECLPERWRRRHPCRPATLSTLGGYVFKSAQFKNCAKLYETLAARESDLPARQNQLLLV